MKKFFTLTLLFLIILSISPVYSKTEKQSTETFELELYTSTQSIFDKSVPLNLNITSNIDSDRVQIRWKMPEGIGAEGNYESVWGALDSGQMVSTQLKIVPKKEGKYSIIAEVQAWQAEANYVDTIKIDLTFDKNLEIQPQSDEYFRNLRLWTIARYAMILLGILVAIALGWFGINRFKKWLAED